MESINKVTESPSDQQATFQHILVVINEHAPSRLALDRACHLARQRQSGGDKTRITAFQCIYNYPAAMLPFLTQAQRNVLKTTRRDQAQHKLSQLISSYTAQGVSIDTQVIWHRHESMAIMEYVKHQPVDLVVIAGHSRSLFDHLKPTTDYQLLRDCPVPVLLVKHHQWAQGGHILTAVDTCHDGQHSLLNTRVIETSMLMAGMLQADIHLLNAYPGEPLSLAIQNHHDKTPLTRNTLRQQHLSALLTLADSYHIPPDHAHVLEGMADDAIPSFAGDLDAELLVVGCLGRHGISGSLLGNTAEYIQDQLDCDILAVKPVGFTPTAD